MSDETADATRLPNVDDTGSPLAPAEGQRIRDSVTGHSDPVGPDGMLTAADVDKVAGSQSRVTGGPSGASAAGQAPGGGVSGRLAGSDSAGIGATNSGGDSMGGDADLSGLTGDGPVNP